MNDVLIHSVTWEEHLSLLRQVFARLQEVGKVAKPTKCSSENFIHKNIAEQSGLLVCPDNGAVSIATVSFSSKFLGQCSVDLELQGETYHGVNLKVLPDLCANVISGHNFLQNYFVLEIAFEGYRPPLRICGLTAAKVPAPSLFSNLAPDCKPIAVKSRRYSEADKLFIESETARMLREEIIRPSRSPWSAQVLVIKGEHHKKRMAVDYSQTINRFTGLDAYPLPHIDETVNNVARFKVYSTPDLRSAYHQVGLTEEEKPYSAFEACGKLFEFNRIPFGVTNGVASFQIVIDGILEKEGVKGTFAYVDDVCVCGDSEEEHDKNLKHFMYVARRYNLTLNLEKCSFRLRSIKLLGYLIQEGENRPDPERLEPLLKLPLPSNTGSLRRTMGMLAHYSRWVLGFSEKIRPLSHANGFPLSAAAKAFEGLKQDIAEAVVRAIDPTAPFAVETDASDHAIAATVTQNDQPVAFFSRTLSNSEQRHSSVKKEAYAIVEALRKWRYYLIGRHFRLVTDQRSVAFMFNSKSADKIKNDKIARWRVELSCYHYDTVYRPSKQNIPTDAFSRVCGATNVDELKELHDNLCHPEVSRMAHFDRCRNLPYSVEELKKMTNSCSACSELKPRFCKFDCGHLIKATQPFERLKIDFKGPLTSHSRNKYILTVVDEFSRFPFAFPCSDMTTGTDALVVDKFPSDLYVYGLGTTAKFLEEKGIKLAEKITSDNLSNIGIPMGSDVYHKFIKGKDEKQGMNLLMSAGGYLLTGPVLRLKQPIPLDNQQANPMMVAWLGEQSPLQFRDMSEDELDPTVHKLWNLATFDIVPKEPSPDNDWTYKQYLDSVVYRDNEYWLRLPWKLNHLQLPVNHFMAQNQLRSQVFPSKK
ncbi:uncharacterized protein [Procambarus clarkii]|uniref:uncharacterized protein n=1 Tax=Procambarus clarkii TaxID=6728 RepID=UPI0037432F6A